MEIKITTNAIDAKHFFDRVARRQLPYAASKAINRLAYDARDDEQFLLGYYFTLRTGWLKKKGAMPVVPSRKGQYPNIFAILGVADQVAALNATGGVRRPGLGGKMAVPIANAGGGKSARQVLNPGQQTLGPRFFPSRIVKPSKMKPARAGSARGKPKPFMLKTKSGKELVAQRGSDGKLQFLYTMKPRVTVAKTWPLVENVSLFVSKSYGSYLEKEMRNAIATAR